LTPVGWREWVALPGLRVGALKAKIDSGARTSSLHAVGIEPFDKGGEAWVRFALQIRPGSTRSTRPRSARLIEMRKVTSSNGESEDRPVIETVLVMAGQAFVTEFTLTERAGMRYRMLVGRRSLAGRYAIDSGASFLGGKPERA
jgi:hypothetical protein